MTSLETVQLLSIYVSALCFSGSVSSGVCAKCVKVSYLILKTVESSVGIHFTFILILSGVLVLNCDDIWPLIV